MNASYPDFLRLPLPAGGIKTLRPILRDSLKEQVFDGYIGWSRIWADMKPLLTRAEWEKRDSFAANFRRNPPEGGLAHTMALFFWMYSQQEPITSGRSPPATLAVQVWNDATGGDLHEDLAALNGDLLIEERHTIEGRWALTCIQHKLSEPTMLSFSLLDLQRPTTHGSLGLYLEVFASRNEQFKGVTAGFTRVTIESEILSNLEAKVHYPASLRVPQPVADGVRIAMRGVQYARHWELESTNGGMLDGLFFLEEAELFSVQPRSDQFEFGMQMTVNFVDLVAVEQDSEGDPTLNAIFTSLHLKGLSDEDRRSGRAVVAVQRYRVDASG